MKTRRKTTSNRKPMRCPYCGNAMILRPASYVYADGDDSRQVYVCNHYPQCNTYVGTHPGTRIPLGTPANGDLRNLRIRAHRKFDQIWQTGIMSRDQAYRWFADYFCLKLKDAHIGLCSEYQCTELIRKCDDILARNSKSAS